MCGIDRAHAAAGAADSVCPVGAVSAGAAGKVGDEWIVVADGDVELCVEAGMAGHRDAEMSNLAVADPWVAGKSYDAVFVDRHDDCCDREILPQDLSLAFALRDVGLAVGRHEGDHQ